MTREYRVGVFHDESRRCPPDVTPKALLQCLDWLIACRRLGWKTQDMDELERLWWRYHDREGRWK